METETTQAKTIITIEPGIFRRISHRTGKPLAPLWIHYAVNGKTFREPAGTTNLVKARHNFGRAGWRSIAGASPAAAPRRY